MVEHGAGTAGHVMRTNAIGARGPISLDPALHHPTASTAP